LAKGIESALSFVGNAGDNGAGMASETVVASGPIGREAELAQLDGALGGARAPWKILLEGEPGIGKTSLWRAAIERARTHGFRVLAARPAEAESTLSFAALGDLLAGAEDDVRGLPDPQRRALRVALIDDALRRVESTPISFLGTRRPVSAGLSLEDVQNDSTRTARPFRRRIGRGPTSGAGAVRAASAVTGADRRAPGGTVLRSP
jgi:hypothetical protein